jgi:hypothetical protein
MENDAIVWSSEGLNRPGSGGFETLTLGDEKTIDFYFGTDDQAPNSYLAGMDGGPVWNIPRRHRCHIVFKDYFIGEYARCPNVQIVAKKVPQIASLTDDWRETWGFDYNPMFSKHYILEDMAEVTCPGLVDYTTWDADAQTLFYEGRGLSIYFKQQRQVREWFDQIDQHIFAGLRDGADGELESKLLRGAETTSSMPSLNPEEDCIEPPQFTRQSWLNTTNELKVQHPFRMFEEVCTWESCTILAASHQVDLGDNMNLDAVCSEGDPGKCNFRWELDGGGSLSSNVGDSVTYTAPETVTGLCRAPAIRLIVNGHAVDTWWVLPTDYENGLVAYLSLDLVNDPTTEANCAPFWGVWPGNMECPDNKCCCWCTYRGYDCAGEETDYYHGWPCGYRVGGGTADVCGDNDPPGSGNCPGGCSGWNGDIIDWRGVCGAECADPDGECCPWDLIMGG